MVLHRLLPAGPTVADLVANAAFYFGLVRHLAESDRPLWSQMSFQAAEENFETAAEDGIDATLYWPGLGEVKATELVGAVLRSLEDPPWVWVTRVGPLSLQDVDVAWLGPTVTAAHERGADPAFVVVTRHGWRDPRSGVGQQWQRIRRR